MRSEAADLLKEKQDASSGAGAIAEVDNDSPKGSLVTKLTGEVANLRDDLDRIKAASGLDYVPGKVRVIHMKENPALVAARSRGGAALNKHQAMQSQSSIPREALKAAKAEIKRLRESTDTANSKGMELEKPTTGVRVEDAPPAAPVPSAIDSSKLNLRLKEMFKERITTFRECVYLLTGWKIDLMFDGCKEQGTSKPQLRLRNMYAEQPEDSLLFLWTEDNKLSLMETPFAKKMNPKLLETLHTLNSVPIFLGAIESELFDNQTIM